MTRIAACWSALLMWVMTPFVVGIGYFVMWQMLNSLNCLRAYSREIQEITDQSEKK